jgi:hypothetical protein
MLFVSPANLGEKWVDPTRLEVAASTMRRWRDALQEIPGGCKIPANRRIHTSAFSHDFRRFTRVAARLLHEGPGLALGTSLMLHVLAAKQHLLGVGDAGLEPATSAV